jgi:hypothetical protein
MVLTVSFALSLVSRAFLPPSQRDAKHHRQLMPASGHQDHTTSPSTKRVARLATPLRPSHPAPTFVTIAKRPSWWVRDGENDASDLGNRTTMHSCDTLARRANHPARVKPCQVTSNCFAEVASANAGAHTPRFVLWPKICDGFLALSHPLVVMGPCVRRDDRGEVRDGSRRAAQHPRNAPPLGLRAVIPGLAKRETGIHSAAMPGEMDSLMCDCTSKLARFTRAAE